MPLERIFSAIRSTHRHVPAHTSYRARRRISATLGVVFLFAALLLQPALADDGPKGAELSVETDLRAKPSDDSRSKGKLPRGTILMLTGDKSEGFVEVEVELESGDISGWISESALKSAPVKNGNLPPETHSEDDNLEVEVIRKKKSKEAREARVPKDEMALLSREMSFFYGVHAGGSFSIINVDQLSDSAMGFGMTFGAQGGFFLSPRIPVTLELAYSSLQGTLSTGQPVGFGLLDIGAIVSYEFKEFEIHAGFKYSIGMSITSLPASVTSVQSPMDVSSPWAQLGVGYRFTIGDQIFLVARARYGISLFRTPIGFQTIGGAAYLEIRG